MTRLADCTHRRQLAQEQFARDLPGLLRDHLGQWALYHGDRRVKVAPHSGPLYEVCRQDGLPLEEVVLFEIFAPDQETPIGPMAFD
jgi:hypothetical protein